MKKCILALVLMTAIVSCNKSKTVESKAAATSDYASFGNKIKEDQALSAEEMMDKYKSLKEGDTADVKFKSKVKAVCKNKGCWMTLDLANNEETSVKFKDYAFFVPKNCENQETVVNGKAFISVESVADQKHYAEDAGKSKAEIEAIVAPKTVYSFMADGVLIKK